MIELGGKLGESLTILAYLDALANIRARKYSSQNLFKSDLFENTLLKKLFQYDIFETVC